MILKTSSAILLCKGVHSNARLLALSSFWPPVPSVPLLHFLIPPPPCRLAIHNRVVKRVDWERWQDEKKKREEDEAARERGPPRAVRESPG